MKKIIYGVLIVSVLGFGVVRGAAQEETYKKEYKLIAEEKAAREKAEQLDQQINQHPVSQHNRQVRQGTANLIKRLTPDLETLEKEYEEAQQIAYKKKSELEEARKQEYEKWTATIRTIQHPIRGTIMKEWEAAKKTSRQSKNQQDFAKEYILGLKYDLEEANYFIQTSNLNPLLFDYGLTRDTMNLQAQVNKISYSITSIQNALNKIIQ